MGRSAMRAVVVLPVLVLLMGGLLRPAAAQTAGGETVKFRWAFGAMVGPEEDRRLVAVEKDRVLHSGDQIKFFLQPRSDCYIYLFYLSAQGELVRLFPADTIETALLPDSQHTVPGNDQWFRLDDQTGPETFYLLASTTRLARLEALSAHHRSLGGASDRQAAAEAVLSEIKHLRRTHRQLKVDAERPVRLGGNFRGAPKTDGPALPDIRDIAVELSAGTFYSRTFSIDHQ
jgi:hypothetical protein